MKTALTQNSVALKCGSTGTIIRVGSRDYYWQSKRGASWIDCLDQHHVGQRSLKFMLRLAMQKSALTK